MLHFFLSISRQLPNFKGKFRLMRFLLQSQLKSVSNIIVHAANGVLYKIPNINEIIGFSIYINGYYEKKYTNYFIESIPLNGVFIDVGANIGSICIPLAKARPDIAIIAIEASSKVLEYLRYNVEINQIKNIKIFHKAVSNINDESLLFDSPTEMFGKGSLNITHSNNTEAVKTITIDEIINQLKLVRVNMIKVDVEGFEKNVFEGMKNIKKQYEVDKIVFEFSEWSESNSVEAKPGNAQMVLLSYGYRIANFDNPPNLIKLNVVLTKGDHMLIAY